MDDVFISYSRRDKAFATRLHEALKARQRETWVDLEDISPSDEWSEYIKAGIEGARAFVFVISPDSLTSPECLAELDYAAAKNKRLIPVVCREVDTQAVAEALGRLNWIFLREQDDFDKGIDILLTAVDTDLEWVDAHTSLLEKVTEWDHNGRDSSWLLRGKQLREAENWLARSSGKEPKLTELMLQFILESQHDEAGRHPQTIAESYVFFCYAREDQDFALKLAQNLKNRGVNIWIDQWNIGPGKDWDQEIDKALDDCGKFLIILSPNSIESLEVRGELRMALDGKKNIVPLLYKECRIPRQLRVLQYTDFTRSNPDDDIKLTELIANL
jgi:hypothetical protein